MSKIKISNRFIGDDFPCYTIAEAGANHDGELQKALKLIDAAIESNSDSIKFQTYNASKLASKFAPKYWDDGKPDESQYDVFSNLDSLTEDDWREIFEYAKKKAITCFSTPFDEESVDLLYSLDVPAFKIASADLTHTPLIKHIASKKLPIFISTGMANNEEIQEAINNIEDEGNHEIVIMHCMTSYPTKPEDANLDMIRTLKERYPEYVIGYSDHTIGTNIPVYSTFYGATCIEKHFTFDNTLKQSPDHKLSLDTNGFKRLVNELRLAEISKGKEERENFDAEEKAVKFARRSVIANRTIRVGEKITKEMLSVKRPGTGIAPKFLDKIIGLTVKKDIQEDKPILWENIDKEK
jgi:sialic acid synthase SpsE|tara:strand:- start:1644 stop:2702 length:1059 start_codon:yes stop_codon:yes gene_type:complete